MREKPRRSDHCAELLSSKVIDKWFRAEGGRTQIMRPPRRRFRRRSTATWRTPQDAVRKAGSPRPARILRLGRVE